MDRRAILLGWCFALFCSALFLFTRHNSFPAEFHPDESPKAVQVIEHRPTYRQPLLLISATELLTWLNGAKSVRLVVLTGRIVSAAFAASAIVLIALFAYTSRGESLRAAVGVGIVALSCPQLLLLAHYMKEDTAFVFGGAAFLLASWYDERARTTRSAVLLGIASALLASAKYIGLLSIPLACWLFASGRSRAADDRSWRPFIVSLIATWCAVNYLVVVNPLRFFSNFATEAAHPVAGHHGLADSILLASPVWEMLGAQANGWVLVAATIYLAIMLPRWTRLSRVNRVFLVGPVIYLVLLCLSRFVLDRHVLPVTLAAYTMAGFFALEVAELGKSTASRWVVTLIGCCAIVVASIRPVAAIYHELRQETRLQLRAWMQTNLPTSAVIAQDRPAHLNISEPEFLETYGKLPQIVLTPRDLFVTDLGSLAELRAQGVTHVVTCDEAYSRIFTDRVISAAARDEYRVRRARYEEIFASGKLLFEARPQRPIGGSTSPVVRVYAISG